MNIERPWNLAGGVLSIIAGSLYLVGWLAVAMILNRLIGVGYFAENVPLSSAASIWIVALPFLILAVIAIIGGIFALNKKYWGFALAGAICAIFSPATWIIGVTATVFICISKREFSQRNDKSLS